MSGVVSRRQVPRTVPRARYRVSMDMGLRSTPQMPVSRFAPVAVVPGHDPDRDPGVHCPVLVQGPLPVQDWHVQVEEYGVHSSGLPPEQVHRLAAVGRGQHLIPLSLQHRLEHPTDQVHVVHDQNPKGRSAPSRGTETGFESNIGSPRSARGERLAVTEINGLIPPFPPSAPPKFGPRCRFCRGPARIPSRGPTVLRPGIDFRLARDTLGSSLSHSPRSRLACPDPRAAARPSLNWRS